MDKEDNYSTPNFAALDYDIDRNHNHNHNHHHHHHHHHHHQDSEDHQNGDGLMVNYLLNNLPHQHQPQLSFADVMQFADFGPKLALNQTRISEEGEEGDEAEGDQSGMDPVFFLKFPVLNDKNISVVDQSLVVCHDDLHEGEERFIRAMSGHAKDKEIVIGDGQEHDNSVQLQFLGDQDLDDQKSNDNDNNNNNIGNPSGSHEVANNNSKNKRKRARTVKSTEEVESQRMTHIAVERNRRKQMNEHLRVLRSLMPGSYVQRGDQASIIGGAIEFVRELEQLLQCLESQKRRRLLGSDQTPIRPAGAGPDSGVVSNNAGVLINPQPLGPPFFPPNNIPLPDDMSCFEAAVGGGPREETAESKSCLADVEVKLLGFDAMIKILSRRRPGQLIKAIAALEDLQFNILHTNITTIEQTVLYSFNVKVTSESRFSAEDIASSVQQIFSFIHANSTI